MNFKKTVAIAAAAGALTALAVPAMAEFTPYASIRLLTGYQNNDPNTTGSKTDTDLFFKSAGSSRLGVKFSDGALAGVVEFGINEDGGNITNRLLFGTYKMDSGTLKVGQDYTKSWNPSAAITDDRPSNGGWGNFYAGRLPQIMMTFNNGFYVGVIQPSTVVSTPVTTAVGTAVGNPAPAVANKDQELFLPKLNVGYDGKAGAVGYGVGAEVQTYKSEALGKQINSFLVYARATMATGPIALKANLGAGQNLGNAGFTGAAYTGGKNSTTIEGFVQAGYTVSPTLKVQAIIGGQTNDNSNYAKADSRMAYAINAPITIAKNFTVTPEVQLFDEMKDAAGAKQKQDIYFGAKWQLDF